MEKIKIICIADNKLLEKIGASYYVKYNGIYEAEIEDNSYRISLYPNISGYSVNIDKKYFITMAKWRDKQINDILDD
jgi:hypothetical protein